MSKIACFLKKKPLAPEGMNITKIKVKKIIFLCVGQTTINWVIGYTGDQVIRYTGATARPMKRNTKHHWNWLYVNYAFSEKEDKETTFFCILLKRVVHVIQVVKVVQLISFSGWLRWLDWSGGLGELKLRTLHILPTLTTRFSDWLSDWKGSADNDRTFVRIKF